MLSEQDQIREEENRARLRDCLTSFLRAQGYLTQSRSDPGLILTAWLSYIAAGPAALLLINVEDLWLEEKPQNVPGTWGEKPNWKRKALYSLEEFSHMPEILAVLRIIDEFRKEAKPVTSEE